MELIPETDIDVFKSLEDIQVVFDVGARTDTVYLDIYPDIECHLFEPNPMFFSELVRKVGGKKNVHLNNFGLGDTQGKFAYSDYLQAFEKGEAEVWGTNQVFEIRTLDSYIEENNIKRIDFLKIDAEGYDFKVLKGGQKAVKIARYIQYEHWDNTQQFHDLLGNDFEMKIIGNRNVLCTRK